MIMQFRGFLGFALFVAGVTLAACGSLKGFKVIDVTPTTPAHLRILRNIIREDGNFYDFFAYPALRRTSRVLVHPAGLEKLTETLAQHSIEFQQPAVNIGEGFEREISLHRLLRKVKPYKFGQRLSTERYYTHDEINAYIEDLAKRYSNRVTIKTVGKSYEGRSLKALTITNGDRRVNKKVVLMDGGFHAREWISPATAVYVIGELVENFAEHAELLQDYDWIALPVVNPDGYEYTQISAETRIWRKTRKPSENSTQNCIGTDPNRNFDFHWNEEGASSNPCDNTYAGPKAFSEPETITVRDLIHTVRGRGVMYLTLHSYGSLLLYPWGWTSDLPDTWPDLHEVAEAGADAMHAATGTAYTVGSSTNVLYVAAGASDDYAFNDGFPISYTMELPAGGTNGFDPPPSSIDSYVKEAWIGIRAMAKRCVQKYPLQ